MALNPFRRRKKLQPELAALLKTHFNISASDAALYELAMTHSSAKKGNNGHNNERMEFLGDSILDAVVTHLLFERHPKVKEGELTKMRSAIVSRNRLNSLGKKIGLMALLDKDKKQNLNNSAVCGNALEALIGAIYLEKGFNRTQKAIEYFLSKHMEAEEFAQSIKDAKSRLLEWGQKNSVDVKFITKENEENNKLFGSVAVVESAEMGAGTGTSKKKAEMQAAAIALGQLIDD